MKTARLAVLTAVAAAGLACGAETGTISVSDANPAAAPVALLAFTNAPGCYATVPALEDVVGDARMHARLELALMQVSFDLASASLLTKPIVEAPHQLNWDSSTEGMNYTARSIVRGERWGLIEAGIESTSPAVAAGGFVERGTIAYSPDRTRYDIQKSVPGERNDFTAEVTADAMRVGNVGRACDDNVGMVLDLVPPRWPGEVPLLVCRGTPTAPVPQSEWLCRRAARSAWGDDVDHTGIALLLL